MQLKHLKCLMCKSDRQREDAETCWHLWVVGILKYFFCKMKIHLNPLLQLIQVNGMQWRSNFRIFFFFYATASTKKRKWSIKLRQYSSFKGLMINLSQIIQIKKKKADGSWGRAKAFAARLFIQPMLLHLQFTKKYRVCGGKKETWHF